MSTQDPTLLFSAKRKLTAAEKAEKRRRKAEYKTIFINGKQKRVKRSPKIDGMDVDEYMRRNADPIWLHQNGLWEYMSDDKGPGDRPDRIVTPYKKNGGSMNPDKIIDGLTKELNAALKAMAKAKDITEKETHSRIVKNLCESLGVFFDLANEMMPFDFDDDSKSDDTPF
jgi:hypothetical protein